VNSGNQGGGGGADTSPAVVHQRLEQEHLEGVDYPRASKSDLILHTKGDLNLARYGAGCTTGAHTGASSDE